MADDEKAWEQMEELADEMGIDVTTENSLEGAAVDIFANAPYHLSEMYLDELAESMDGRLTQQRAYHRGFRQRLHAKWSEPVDLLELFVLDYVSFGAEMNSEQRESAAENEDYMFDVLVRLHSRSCQVSHEILCLLKNGFASGALARWRTFHEIVVTASFIREHGQEAARRYIQHQDIIDYYFVENYQNHVERLGYEPFTDDEVEIVTRRKNELVRKYSKKFKSFWGWAVEFSDKSSLNFEDMEKAVDLDHLHPFYKRASDDIHATFRGVRERIGLIDSEKPANEVLVAGPSNYGLTDPAHCLAISMSQMASCLMMMDPSFENTGRVHAYNQLVDEIGESFLEVQRQIESEEREQSNAN